MRVIDLFSYDCDVFCVLWLVEQVAMMFQQVYLGSDVVVNQNPKKMSHSHKQVISTTVQLFAQDRQVVLTFSVAALVLFPYISFVYQHNH